MNVALDSNQLIADRWLESQRFQVLAHYLQKTSSRLWILAPVLTEVREHHRRDVAAAVNQVLGAGEALRRLGVKVAVPKCDGVVDTAVADWFDGFQQAIAAVGTILPFDPTVSEEALRRASARTPPCKASGAGMQDAMIWLNLLSACQTQKVSAVAFISSNTKDFAEPDGTSLRPELVEDTAKTGVTVAYYTDVAGFNRAHSDRIAHITLEWLTERVALDDVALVIQAYIETHPELLHPQTRGRQHLYAPRGFPYVHSVTASIDDYSVWKLEPNRIAISIAASAYVEADAECRYVGPSSAYSLRYEEPEMPSLSVEVCAAELGFYVTAEVHGDEIELGQVDDIYYV